MALSSPPAAHSPLDQKILDHFPGLVVRKGLTIELKQNAVVPTYVLEHLFGHHCATDDPTMIGRGPGVSPAHPLQAMCTAIRRSW
jgi:predicted ATP-dependent Lon-type protease